MKTPSTSPKRGFTLLETVIAIGVLAVLLTGFVVVFAPAAVGIRKAINVQEADRLASTLEQELVTKRTGDAWTNNFDKAFNLIKGSVGGSSDNALLIYKYRGSLSSLNADGTPTPMATITGLPGKDYVVQTIMRRKSDPNVASDLAALDGPVFLVKCTQLVFNAGTLKTGTAGTIVDPNNTGTASASSDVYPEAVLAFTAEFYLVPSRSAGYFGTGGKFSSYFTSARNPVFTRNLAVRR